VESLVNQNMTSNFIEIKDHILNFYKHLYSEQYLWRPKLDGFSFRSIDVEEEIGWKENLRSEDLIGFLWLFSRSVEKC
jgi:hypothetical protein